MKLFQRLFGRRNSKNRWAKTRQPDLARNRFFVEPLEGRAMLAGNVLASVSLAGDLTVTGDASSNNISIHFDTTTGSYLITGTNTTINGSSTTVNVNGLAMAATGAAFTGAMNINMAGGNDVVAVAGDHSTAASVLHSSLSVDGGIGNDSITIDQMATEGELTVTGGDGNDKISLTNTNCVATISISGGAGNDSIVVDTLAEFDGIGIIIDTGADNDNLAVSHATTNGSMLVSGGLGKDKFALSDLDVSGALQVSASTSASNKDDGDKVSIDSATVDSLDVNVVGHSHQQIAISNVTVGVTSGSGLATITADGTGSVDLDISELTVLSDLFSAGSLAIKLGSGNDKVNISDVSFQPAADPRGGVGTVSIDTGAGNDALSIFNFSLSGGGGPVLMNVAAGAGNDTVSISQLETKNLSVDLGSGKNKLTANDLSIATDVAITGSTGQDTVSIGLSSAMSNTIGRDLSINLGSSNDKVTVSGGTTVGGKVAIDTAGGNDKIDLSDLILSSAASGSSGTGAATLTINAGTDGDTIKLTSVLVAATADAGGSVAIDAGSGDDKVDISGLSVAAATSTGDGGSVSVFGGIGRDNINLSGVNLAASTGSVVASFIAIDAGANDDKVSISDSSADDFFATLGGGVDTLSASGNLAFKHSIHVVGGSDKDTLNGKTALTDNPTASLLLDLETIKP
jgi:hypothetical protein